jgi:amino acid adenylation domain-containing protein
VFAGLDVLAAVERSARDHADQPAISAGGSTLTHRELWEAAGGIAHLLGSGAGRVGLVGTKSTTTFAAYLGILRAGAAVVPISPLVPASRVRDILDTADVSAVLSDVAVPLEGHRFIDPTGSRPRSRVRGHPGPDDVAYVIFTSGSTGRPKGVPITHANMRAYLSHVVERYAPTPGSRVVQSIDLSFDSSTFDMFAAWTTGAHSIAPSRAEWRKPVRFLREHRISHLLTVPSTIALAAGTRTLLPGSLPELRWSLFGGEPLHADLAATWRAAAVNTVLENVYGPTELTVTCCQFRLPGEQPPPPTRNGTVPIGSPYPGTEIAIITPDGRTAAEGELVVRGAQRFSGYLDPRDNRFLMEGPTGTLIPRDGPPTPRDWYRTGDLVYREEGQLVHLGRVDRQVKLHGHRIELAEIERALRESGGSDAVVIVQDNQLHGYYLGGPGDSARIRARLRDRLPTYMIPVVLRALPEFPLTPAGKIDMSALRADPAGRA